MRMVKLNFRITMKWLLYLKAWRLQNQFLRRKDINLSPWMKSKKVERIKITVSYPEKC
jgi:hypothetical protein